MDVAVQLRLHRGIDPVAELCHPLVQALPEQDPFRDRWRRIDRAKHGDVFVTNLATDPARLHQADLQFESGESARTW